ncbi:cob(I)yrinic acid a,c-diamide adenosyltransferase [Blastococcus sp. Marseille-P5729]|uniref:cob(I)yrinic acid a,c-diamide adenosyltransferase n=1 Tax=Blastococcus sp. Marseille-P5729 TaxID=2086582 RepID=UPI000D104CDD|nr:cob(I)yrinic acid a,c-diamide adenosyltransferase [Blastococcus sp. Marseille-P5729]
MAVHLTRIYTRTGDAGTTGLGDFSRISKTDARLQAYADCDEANSVLGLVLAPMCAADVDDRLRAILTRIQNDLFDVGADLCTPFDPNPKYPPLRVEPDYVERLEAWCDELQEGLSKLDSFILPGGTNAAAYLHLARTVTRRAERSTWAAMEQYDDINPLTAKYLNRLSDLLFIAGRHANPNGDVKWVPGGERSG